MSLAIIKSTPSKQRLSCPPQQTHKSQAKQTTSVNAIEAAGLLPSMQLVKVVYEVEGVGSNPRLVEDTCLVAEATPSRVDELLLRGVSSRLTLLCFAASMGH